MGGIMIPNQVVKLKKLQNIIIKLAPLKLCLNKGSIINFLLYC